MDDQTSPGRRDRRRIAAAAGLLAAGAIGGGILASTLSASAAGNGSATSPTATLPDRAGHPFGHGGAKPVRSDEASVSAANAAKLKAAALKAVPGGTVYRIETDAGDAAYEAHMTKADGTMVTGEVRQVVRRDEGRGRHGPRRPPAPRLTPGGQTPQL